MLRKAIYATPLVILTMGAAFAQAPPPPTAPGLPGYSVMRDEQERKSDRAIDRAYESTIKRTGGPDAVKNSDPWGNVRATPPAAAAKNKQQ
jgi:hypothetical protein